MNRNSDPDESPWRGWLVPGALLLVAGVALVITLAPGQSQAPSALTSSSPTPAASLDEHVVVTDQGPVSFRFEDGAIVIRLAQNGAPETELGRTEVQAEVPSPGASPAPAGTALFAMVCGPADGPDSRRYVFGHVNSSAAVQYSGPPSVGHGATDELFLFALLPGALDAAPPIQVKAGKTGPSGGFAVSIFASVVSDGQVQPSGCYVGG